MRISELIAPATHTPLSSGKSNARKRAVWTLHRAPHFVGHHATTLAMYGSCVNVSRRENSRAGFQNLMHIGIHKVGFGGSVGVDEHAREARILGYRADRGPCGDEERFVIGIERGFYRSTLFVLRVN
jgi:hypothetical protein